MEITATNSLTPQVEVLRFPDAKESVMKYCSGVVIDGYIDAYLY
jgi:hypothetical protein